MYLTNTTILRPKMTDKLVSAFSRLLWDSDLIASRFTLAFAELMWGILLLWPGNTFDGTYYRNMLVLASENSWGVLFLLTSIIQFIIVMQNDLHTKCARFFAGYNAVLWIVTIGSVLLVYPLSAALGGEVALACISVWIFVRPYILAEGYKRAK